MIWVVSDSDSPSSWSDPSYVATVVGVVATGALVFYASSTQSGLTVEDVIFVVLVITLPASIAYETARRFK